MAETLKKEVKTFLESDENTSGFELGKISDDTIQIIDSEQEILFNIVIKGSYISVKGIGDLFDENWQNQMDKFCKGGKRTVTDILTKASILYSEILEGGDDDEEDEIEVEVDHLDDEEEEPKPVSKGSSYDTQFEELKKKFKKPEGVSEGAVNCIVKEYIKLCNEDTKSYGYSCHPIDDDLFHWEVRLFDFDKKDTIAQDLAKYEKKTGQNYIQLDMVFPTEFPFKPPFIRVIKPRFKFMTGHVTIGGSICMELLTTSGWRPANSIESIFVQIRCEMMAGGAKLDLDNNTPYTEHEAKEAFFRMSQKYGWK